MTFDHDLIWIPSPHCHQKQKLCGAEREKAGEEKKNPHEMLIFAWLVQFLFTPQTNIGVLSMHAFNQKKTKEKKTRGPHQTETWNT